MPRTRRFTPALLTTTLLAVLFAGLATASPAAAHDALVSSSPAEGEQLATPPAQITLEFSNDVLAMGAEVQVNDASGRNWVEGEATITGATVVATVSDGMPAGAYDVLWKVVSGDGHPISAAIPFTILEGATPTPTASPTLTPTAVRAPAASPAGADADSSTQADLDIRPILIVTAVVIALFLVGLLILLARRYRANRADLDA